MKTDNDNEKLELKKEDIRLIMQIHRHKSLFSEWLMSIITHNVYVNIDDIENSKKKQE